MGKKTNKKKKRRRVKKAPIIILSLILIFIVSASILGYKYYSLYTNGGIKADNDKGTDVNISIKMNTSPKEISYALEDANIVDNALFFYLKAKNDGVTKNFKAGDFVLNTSMSYEEIINTLQSTGQSQQLKLLVKEGETQEDIARNLDDMGIVTYDEFINACNNITYDYKFLKDLPTDEARKNKLEGYLYPDTYFLSENDTAEDIVNRLLRRFDELYTEDLYKKAESLNLTTDEVVTIASIVEREVRYTPEKSIVASVVYNRLEKGIKLQMDATVLYAKGEHSDRTLISDTKIESPYNTYYIEGLPIGPISNPSIDTIKAVLNPADTDYLYYVVKDDATGEHFFTNDYNEFLEAKEKYIKKFD